LNMWTVPKSVRIRSMSKNVGFGSLVDKVGGCICIWWCMKSLGTTFKCLEQAMYLSCANLPFGSRFDLHYLSFVGYSCGRLSQHLRCRIWILKSKPFSSGIRVTRLWPHSSKCSSVGKLDHLLSLSS
jgi:hypothetical protein